jgi:hypothetical protein
MNISEAFKVRSLLKKKIDTLQIQIGQVDYSVSKDTVGNAILERWAILDSKTYDEALTEMDTLRSTLCRLNLAIDKANTVNIEKLSRLHSLDCEISWANSMLQKQRSYQAKKETYDHVQETYVTKEYDRVSTRDWTSVATSLKKEKDDTENIISKNNAITEVKFVIDPSINLY